MPDLERWLGGLGLSPRSQRNHLAALSALVGFAERRGYLPRGWLRLRDIDRPRVASEVQTFTPDALRAILSAARAVREDLLPFLALGAFAGLRHAEALRLDWSDIRDGQIDIRARNAKTRQRRLVPVLDPLPAWLEPHRRAAGPVCRLRDVTHWITRISEAAGVPWVRNGLRHSFGTYRMATLRDEARVALEMGNTPAMVFAHYRAAATEEMGRAWFGVAAP